MPLIYHQLRAIARNQMARERPDHSLQATILGTTLFSSWWEIHTLIGATGRTSSPWHRARCAAC
jgi:hypothetical protein